MTDGLSASDIALLQGNGRNNGDGFGDGNGWWIILFFLCMFGWGGRGFGGFGGNNGSGSAVDGYVLTSDFANIERKIDGVNNGLCDGFGRVVAAGGCEQGERVAACNHAAMHEHWGAQSHDD